MSTTNAYDVIYHYERNGIKSHQVDHIHVAAADNTNASVIAAIKNSMWLGLGPS